MAVDAIHLSAEYDSVHSSEAMLEDSSVAPDPIQNLSEAKSYLDGLDEYMKMCTNTMMPNC